MRHIVIIGLIVLLSGLLNSGCELFQRNSYCRDYASEELILNRTLDFKYSELYCNSEYDFRLSFDSLQDSRCPIGAACIWGGNARVQLIFKQDQENASRFWLNTHINDLTDTVINGIRFELIDVLPYPEVGMDYQLDDYILQIHISD